MHRSITVLIVATVLAGCGVAPLPTLSAAASGVCRGVGVEATLRGAASDARVTWLENPDGSRREIIWPAGFQARFVPGLEVLDGSGQVVIRAGDEVTGGCVAADPHVLLLMPPFK